MDPRLLIPREVLAPLTPMGRKPLNRWVEYGPGGDPYEPRGLFPTQPGQNRLAPGYDGLDADVAPLLWARAEAHAIRTPERPTLVRATTQHASATAPARPARKRRAMPLMALEDSSGSGSGLIYLLVGAGAGVALAYILYDETRGTGARLRRR